MRELSDSFKAHLEGGATTLCQCWRIERADGLIQGFTDHDDLLIFEGVRYEPQSGFTASEAVSTLGLGVDTSEVEGALQSEAISASALHAGDYDNARVTVYAVNWAQPEERVVLRVADIGEVTSDGGLFRAELRGLKHRLNQVQGRLFENTCDADLGDRRCGVDLTDPALQTNGAVLALLDSQTFLASGIDGFADSWFDRGILTWQEGANQGRTIEIESQYRAATDSRLRLWLPMPEAIQPGDRFSLVAGCDKLFATCREKFGNTKNFRGFPHIPGNDFAYGFARSGNANRGRALVR